MMSLSTHIRVGFSLLVIVWLEISVASNMVREKSLVCHSISEVDPSISNISEADLSIQDDPFAEESKIESNRFNYVTKVDASRYRYV